METKPKAIDEKLEEAVSRCKTIYINPGARDHNSHTIRPLEEKGNINVRWPEGGTRENSYKDTLLSEVSFSEEDFPLAVYDFELDKETGDESGHSSLVVYDSLGDLKTGKSTDLSVYLF